MSQPKEILVNVLNKIVEEEKIENHEIKIEEVSSGGANYTSAIYNVLVTSEGGTKLDLFAKVATVSEALRKQMLDGLIFDIERGVYTRLANSYNTIQNKYQVPEQERFKFPKFYGCNGNRAEETIVMENLASQGYTMYDRCQSITWEFASRAVEELAKFHALSFAYQHDYPSDFEESTKLFNFTKLVNFEELRASFMDSAKSTLDYVPDDLRVRVQNHIENEWSKEVFTKYMGAHKWKVLLHGDYKTSNIMYKTENGKVTSMMPLDYQTVHIGSPSTDLIYLIYTATDEVFRKKYLTDLLDHYYENISKFLKIFGLNPETTFSRQDFDEDYKDLLPYGVYVSLILLPVIIVKTEDAPVINQEQGDLSSFWATRPSVIYLKRFIPIIEELVQMGIL